MSIYTPTKKCIKCGIEKPLSEYHKDKQNKDGYRTQCKSCVKEYQRLNRDSINSYNKEYKRENKDSISVYKKEYYQQNKDSIITRSKEYYQQNKDSISDYKKEHYQQNKDSINTRSKEYNIRRRNTDPLFKLKNNIRNRIGDSIRNRGYRKNTRTHDILGCDWNTLKEHLESLFDDNMSWDNQGKYWDIDHIIPVSSAKTEEEIIKLNHYTNLQPLESYYNRHIKRAKLNPILYHSSSSSSSYSSS